METQDESDRLHKGAAARLYSFARVNRKTSTEAERLLWYSLRNRKLMGLKFRRQHPLGDFIADFFCLERNLVIELDGLYHDEVGQRQYNQGRVFEMEELAITVIRFSNEEVVNRLGDVLGVIRRCVTPGSHHLTPGPSPQGEG